MQTEIDKLIGKLGQLIPEYTKNPLGAFADGNVAVCIVDDYEQLLFDDEFDEKQFGIEKPDVIAWEWGQSIVLKNGANVSVGFCGFRGVCDGKRKPFGGNTLKVLNNAVLCWTF
jgi:hypothetical protein